MSTLQKENRLCRSSRFNQVREEGSGGAEKREVGRQTSQGKGEVR